jgi:hypothetical protein
MKNKLIRNGLIVLMVTSTLGSCKLWNNIFNREPKRGCPTDGRTVGAEQVLENTPEAKKAKKAKWRGGK